jgi:hypothetical protein
MPDRLPPNHVYAGDINRHHLGRMVSVDGVTGILREFGHIDDSLAQLLIDSRIVTVPAGRPVAVAPD